MTVTSVHGQTYSDVAGPNISFTDIVETSGDGLFGQPNANGDGLNFPSTGFSAEGVDGAIDFVNGMLELEASSNSGMLFNSVSLDEFGVYFNFEDSFSSVDGFLTVVTADGTYTDSFELEFGEGSGTWVGNATVSFPSTDSAEIFVHNILLADSDGDQVASINKRDVSISVGVIPEPSTVGLLGLGLLGLVTRRRR
jgi:hypothetical protein